MACLPAVAVMNLNEVNRIQWQYPQLLPSPAAVNHAHPAVTACSETPQAPEHSGVNAD
jgi:hypothetical protein